MGALHSVRGVGIQNMYTLERVILECPGSSARGSSARHRSLQRENVKGELSEHAYWQNVGKFYFEATDPEFYMIHHLVHEPDPQILAIGTILGE